MKMAGRSTVYAAWYAGVALSFLFGEAISQPAQEIARKAFSGVTLIVVENDAGQPVSLGSGFIVGDGLIATNLHVIEGGSRGYVKLIGKPEKLSIEGTVGLDPVHDLALLQVARGRGGALSLSTNDSMEVGEVVYAVGNPQGLEGTFSQGIISGIRTVKSERLLQITAPISPGSSGGPVLNSQGQIIGVAVATYRGGQNLNFAVPVEYLRTLLSLPQKLSPLSGKRSRQGKSIVADTGGRSTEAVIGGQLTWQYLHGQNGQYAFSLRNRLQESVKNVVCLVVFYDAQGSPIDADMIRYSDSIPPGLARRVTSQVEGGVQKLTTPRGELSPKTRVDFRILDFQIVN